MHQILEENVAVVWERWSKQAGELQLLHINVENQRRVRESVYKMDQESIITIHEELMKGL